MPHELPEGFELEQDDKDDLPEGFVLETVPELPAGFELETPDVPEGFELEAPVPTGRLGKPHPSVGPSELGPIGRVGAAAFGPVVEAFETDLGLDEETTDLFRRLGVFPTKAPPEGFLQGTAAAPRTVNYIAAELGVAGLQIVFRGMEGILGGIVGGTGQILREAGVSNTSAKRAERDLHAMLITTMIVSGGGPPRGPRLPTKPRSL